MKFPPPPPDQNTAMADDPDRRLHRRSLIRGTAWSVPVLAATAAIPLSAASTLCSPTAATLDFGTQYTRASVTSGTAVVPIIGEGQSPLTVTFVSDMQGYSPAVNFNYVADSGTAWEGLRFQQNRNPTTPTNNSAFGQVITIMFARPVTDLVLPFDNFSWPTSDVYRDQLIISTPGFTYTRGSNITGAGTAASPFRSLSSSDTLFTGSAVTTTVEYAGPISSVTVRFYDGEGSFFSSQHSIVLRDMSFVASCP